MGLWALWCTHFLTPFSTSEEDTSSHVVLKDIQCVKCLKSFASNVSKYVHMWRAILMTWSFFSSMIIMMVMVKWGSHGQGKLNGHLQNYFATLGFLVMLRLATDLKSRLVTAWGNTDGKNVVFFRHARWVSLFLNQQSVQNIVFWCLICLNARVKLNVNILGVWSKVKFRYRTRNTYYRPHIYSYISHWVVCQVLTNRYLM